MDRETIIDALKTLDGLDPDAVRGVSIRGAAVAVTLAGPEDAEAREALRAAAGRVLDDLEGVERAEVYLAEARSPEADPSVRPAEAPSQRDPAAPLELPGVKNIVAVGAGKGGVGKSTIAVHLAIGLGRRGLKVGLLDADVYGPSIATMLDFEGVPATPAGGGRIDPFDVGGIKAISIANFVQAQAPMIWRGPMIHGVVRQFLGDVDWGDLDYLILDLPPGTGDVPLTLAQSVGVTGAVIVSTPQTVALNDAVRAARMYQQLGIAVLGFVENMSFFVCGECGAEQDIFGRGGVSGAAERLGLEVLAELPLTTSVRRNTDTGRAGADFADDSPVAACTETMISNLLAAVEKRCAEGAPPKPLDVRQG